MKRINLFSSILTLLFLLCSCFNNTPKYCIGETAPVHEYFQATVTTKSTSNILEYKDKNNKTQVLETNGKDTFISLNVVISCNRTTGVSYTFDKDDFKLTDNLIGSNSVGDIKAFEDYTWIGTKIETAKTVELSLYFKVSVLVIEEYTYLEIDFKNSPGNSTKIFLESRD